MEIFISFGSDHNIHTTQDSKNSGHALALEERISFIRVKRSALPWCSIDRAVQYLSREFVNDVLFDVWLGRNAVRAPVFTSNRILSPCKDSDGVLLLLSDFVKNFLELNGVGNFDEFFHFARYWLSLYNLINY